MASDRRSYELQVLADDRAHPCGSSCGAIPVHELPGDRIFIPEGILQLALPSVDAFGISMARWPANPGAELPFAAMARPPPAHFEVSAAGVLHVGSRQYVSWSHRGVHGQPLWRDRRRSHVELLSLPWRNCRSRARRSGCGLGICAELLVPLSVSVWSAAGNSFFSESSSDSPIGAGLYRLRKVRQSMPVNAASRQTGNDQIRGVHRMFGMCRNLSSRKRAADVTSWLDTLSQARPPLSLSDGRGNCSSVSRNRWFRESNRPLERRGSRLRLPATSAASGRNFPSRRMICSYCSSSAHFSFGKPRLRVSTF